MISKNGGDKVEVHSKIEQLMKERKWTRYRLARESGLSSSTVSNLFYRNNVPTLSTLEAVADAFGITLSQFFCEEGEAVDLSDEQKQLLHQWSLLTKKQRKLMLALMKSYRDT